MRTAGKILIVLSLVLGFGASRAKALVTLSCVPDTTTVTGGGIITVECFISNTDTAQTIGGIQIDLPCALPDGMGGTSGSIDVTNISVDPVHDIATFPPFGDTIFFPGLFPINVFQCTAAGAPSPGGPAITLQPGDTKYLATYEYAVSDCAKGEFILRFEGFSFPPAENDSTKIRDAVSGGALVAFAAFDVPITVVAGQCCSPGSCSDLNETCCAAFGGTWNQFATCADGCSCTTNAECDDGVFCNGRETCGAGGTCEGGVAPCTNLPGRFCSEDLMTCVECLTGADCDDGNPCTDDVCDPGGNCQNPNNTAPCNDGLFCTDGDACSGGSCVGGADPCAGTNLPLCDEANVRCVQCFDDTDCIDTIFCNGVETCSVGSGFCNRLRRDCDDGIDCTTDSCDTGLDECVNEPDDALCDNGVFCDGVEVCSTTSGCVSPGRNCDDGVGCTVDSCDTGLDQCVNTPDDTLCDDGVFCNGDETCDEFNDCQQGSDPCPGQACDEPGQACADCLVDGDCDNGVFCDGVETCASGVCQGGSDPCPGQACDEAGRVCVNCLRDEDCDNGDFCDGVESCDAGNCIAGTDVDCTDAVSCTDDVCNEVTDSCDHTPNDSLCADGQFCNGVETCDAVNDCQPGTDVDCDDGVDCTDDGCNETTDSCDHSPNDGFCDDGLFCTGVESCNVFDDCQPGSDPCPGQACDEVGGACVNCLRDEDCDNGDFCDGVESCDAGNCIAGTNVDCGDGVSCTDDVCNEVTDSCDHTPNDSLCADPNFCNGVETCDAVNGCQAGSDPCVGSTCDEAGDRCVECLDDTDCDDLNDCTVDACVNGTCSNDPEAAGTVCGDVSTNPCDGTDTCDGAGRCLDNIEPNGTMCSDGTFCNGEESCRNGVCESGGAPCPTPAHCNEAGDACFECVAADECNDRNPCTEDACTGNACVNTPIPDCVFALDARATVSTKGSLMIFPKVEMKWRQRLTDGDQLADQFVLIQDTFVAFTNDFPADVDVQAYFINGDEPTDAIYVGDPPQLVERAHDGWNWVDCQFTLTNDQSNFWSARSGRPIGCQPFAILDPGTPPGRPDTDGNPGDRVLRGYVVAWAVDRNGEEIAWNHLQGSATIVNYADMSAWEYNAYSFQTVSAPMGEAPDATPGSLNLDGQEYDQPFNRLVFDFHASGSSALSHPSGLVDVLAESDLTLLPVTADLRQDGVGPITTKAKFDIWNQNEVRFSGTTRCITCWDQTLLRNYGIPNHFVEANLQTARGKARVAGVASSLCEFSVDSPLLGVLMKRLAFFVQNGAVETPPQFAQSAVTLRGQGLTEGLIQFDIIARPQEATKETKAGGPGFESGSVTRPFRMGKLRRQR